MTTIGEIIAEIVERSARSEQVDREAYLARYPEHADSLGEFFKNFDVIDAIVGAPNRSRMRNGGAPSSAGDSGATGVHFCPAPGRVPGIAAMMDRRRVQPGGAGFHVTRTPRKTEILGT